MAFLPVAAGRPGVVARSARAATLRELAARVLAWEATTALRAAAARQQAQPALARGAKVAHLMVERRERVARAGRTRNRSEVRPK